MEDDGGWQDGSGDVVGGGVVGTSEQQVQELLGTSDWPSDTQ